MNILFLLALLAMPTIAADLSENPADIYAQGTSNPEVQALLEEMRAVSHSIASQQRDYFDVTTSLCPLDPDSYYAVSGINAEIEQGQQKNLQSAGMGSKKTLNWIRLTQGRCDNGLPAGEFVATFQLREDIVHPGGHAPSKFEMLFQVKGTMVGGRMEGLALTEGWMADLNAPNSRPQATVTSSVYKGGVAEVSISLIAGMPHITRTVDTSYGRKTFAKMFDSDGQLMSESQRLNGMLHGESVSAFGNMIQRSCWRYGKVSKSLDDCASIRLSPALLAKFSDQQLDELAILNNTGTFISPYTTDGTLAEWVNAVVAIDMGISIGALVGSVSAAAAAGMLDFIPYGLGGLVAAAIGGYYGKQIGKAQGLEAVGGMDTLRAGSDLSFASLDDMATYLTAKYANEVTFTEAVRAATVIYPGLSQAMDRLR